MLNIEIGLVLYTEATFCIDREIAREVSRKRVFVSDRETEVQDGGRKK